MKLEGRLFRNIFTAAAILVVASAAQAHGRAAPNPATDTAIFDRRRYEVETPDRKKKSLFRRVARKTAAEQMAYAQQLETRGRLRKARRAYNALVHRWHTSREAPEAQLSVAILHERQGRNLKAFQEYQYALDNFPGHFPQNAIVDKQFALANLLRSELDRGWFGFGREAGHDEVIGLLRQVTRNAPAGAHAAESLYLMGLTYEADKNWEDAISPYESLAARFPRHELTPSALFRAALCRAKLTTRNPRDEQLLRNAISALTALKRDYPAHPETETIDNTRAELRTRFVEMQFEQAEFYDNIRKSPSGAQVAYGEFIRVFAGWPEAEKLTKASRERMAELKNLNPEKDDNQL